MSTYIRYPILPTGTVTDVTAVGPIISSGGIVPSISINQSTASTDGFLSYTDWNTFNNKQAPNSFPDIYYHYPIDVAVIENDIVMSITNLITGQAPLKFIQATNGGETYYPALYGVAKNVSGGFADIYLGFGSVVPGFNFGLFIGVEYYLDPANPGKLVYNPPTVGSSVNPIKIGRAMDASNLILMPVGNFVQAKGYLYTSDGSYDETFAVGSNGNALIADSTQTLGLKWAPSIIASAPFTFVTATRTLTIATATTSITGALTSTDWNTFNNKAPTVSPIFTGDVNSSTGNVLVSTLGKSLQIKTGVNSKIGIAVLIAGTVTVSNTSVTANSRIFVTSQTDGGTPGGLRVSAKTVSTSFVIKSTSATDTSTVAWMIVESIP